MSGTLLRAVRVFDGLEIVDADAVRLRDGLVAEVGTDLRQEPDEDVVDGTGGTVLPGLVDAHVHVRHGSLEQALAFGVTTEIDMFSDPAVAAELRTRAAQRDDLADVRVAGTGATVAGGHPTHLVERGIYPPFPVLGDGTDPAAFVADRVREGSDHLKIFVDDGAVVAYPHPTLDADTVTALVRAAHDHGLLAVVHPADHAAAEIAVAAGADGLAHLPADRAPSADLVAALVAADTFVIPTLGVLDAVAGHGAGPRLAADPRVAPYLDEMSVMMLTMMGGNFSLGENAYPDPAAWASLAALRDAGVTLVAGTDAGTLGVAHGASLHHELTLLVGAGLTPTEALTAATATPARVFGLPDRGRLTPGLRADVLLVGGDPTTDVTTTLDVRAVWRRGTRATRTTGRAGSRYS